jgi:hypothetical protein
MLGVSRVCHDVVGVGVGGAVCPSWEQCDVFARLVRGAVTRGFDVLPG